MSQYRFLFGPVPSRRFGRSLGVDLVPFKTCTYNCIFCQLGPTTHLTNTSQEFVPIDAVLEELRHWFQTNGQADYITLSGSGEPTLHSRFGQVLDLVKKEFSLPTLLLTNGSLLYRPEVREMASQADVVKISLSAWDEASYQHINRHHPDVHFSDLIHGESALRAAFTGLLFMEVFILQGINDSPDQIQKIASIAQNIKPDKIQLNTSIRPPAETWAQPVDQETLQRLTTYFSPPAEIIADFSPHDTSYNTHKADSEMILSLLERRPCTLGDVSHIFNMHPNETSKYIGYLIRDNKVSVTHQNGEVYYIGLLESNQKDADI
jgi:wyosine [tRNA(Phe)-imidazoG37] synthetase (radical SAM superfamily)